MRLFLALELPADVKARVVEQVWSRREWWPDEADTHLRRLPEENLHVTLKFFGETPDEQMTNLGSALTAIPRVGSLQLRTEQLGFFPPKGRPRVFVTHLAGELERLGKLHELAEAAAAEVGVTGDAHGFKPHITLARSKDRVGAPIWIRSRILANRMLRGEPFTVDTLTLFRSDIRREGAVYSAVQRYALT